MPSVRVSFHRWNYERDWATRDLRSIQSQRGGLAPGARADREPSGRLYLIADVGEPLFRSLWRRYLRVRMFSLPR